MTPEQQKMWDILSNRHYYKGQNLFNWVLEIRMDLLERNINPEDHYLVLPRSAKNELVDCQTLVTLDIMTRQTHCELYGMRIIWVDE